MIIVRLKAVIPYFDRENESFLNFDEEPKAGFSLNKGDYFLDRHESEFFEFESWIDVIISPYYMINSETENSLKYSKPLFDLFYKIFPTPKDFDDSIQGCSGELSSLLSDLKRRHKTKQAILNRVIEMQRLISNAEEKLRKIDASDSSNEYLKISLHQLKAFGAELSNFSDNIILTEQLILKCQYYENLPGEPWEENPLSFFTNALYRNGVDTILNERVTDMEQYGDVDTPADYFERVYRREYYVALRLLIEKLSNLGSKAKKQLYVDELCEKISTLFNKSLAHPVKNYYPGHLRPYRLLIRQLKIKYKTLSFDVGFSDDEENDPEVETRDFLKRLQSLEIMDRDGRMRPLFKNKISTSQLGALITGDYDKMPEIHFQWQTEQVYYLLVKLLINKASFNPAKLEQSRRIYLEDETSFLAANFYPYRRKIKIGEKPSPKEFEKIDTLFRQDLSSQISS